MRNVRLSTHSSLLRSSALSVVIALGLSVSLSACGGGGGSSGTVSVSPPPPPPPPTGQGLILPSIIQSRTQENLSNGVFDRIEFDVTATDTTLTPTNFRLEGNDAFGFELATVVSATANPNVFRTIIDFDNTQPFDFEMPTDENSDNVYSFDYVFEYGETTYNVPVEITIINVDENTAISGSVVRLEFQPTGLFKAPDVSGDGLPDVILLENDNFFDSGVYILSSETIAASDGLYNVVNNDALFSDFMSSRDGFERLSIQDSADGQGLDILYSDTFEDSFKYYDADVAADWAFLQGNVDPDAAANNGISYTRSNVNDLIDAQMIHDVNQDGQNDIFAYGRGNGEISLRFGAAQSGPADTTRPATADISFVSDDLTGVRPAREYDVRTFPDIDSDGQPELLLVNPLYLAGGSSQGNGAIWIVNSTRLAAAPSTIDLDDVNDTGVRRVIGDADNKFGSSFVETTDSNGNPFFLIGVDDDLNSNPDVGVVGITLANLQALPRQATQDELLGSGVIYVQGPDPASGFTNNSIIGPLTETGDFDGDGANDFMSNSSNLVKKSDILAGELKTGDVHVIDFDSAPRIQREFFAGNSSGILDLSEQGLVGFFQGGTDGEFLIVPLSEIQRVINAPDGNLVFETPSP